MPVAPKLDLRARTLGCVVGAAIGDALGHPTEFVRSFEAIRRQFPPAGVTGYALMWERDGVRFAPYTDDTQMAEIVLRALLEGRQAGDGLDATMNRMAAGFVEWARAPQGGHRAPGRACLAGCERLAAGVPWNQAGDAKAGGCGSVMRAYPFALLIADEAEAESWAVAHSKLTHGDPIALAACAGMTAAVAASLGGRAPDAIAAAAAARAGHHDAGTGRLVEDAAKAAFAGNPPEDELSRLQGWAAHEALAAGIYVFCRHPDDFAAAALEAANTPGDSDSIATITGALVGARLGVDALPLAWIADLERSEDLVALAEDAAAFARQVRAG